MSSKCTTFLQFGQFWPSPKHQFRIRCVYPILSMEGLTVYLAYAFEALCFCAIINADTIIISFEKISDSEHCRFIIFGLAINFWRNSDPFKTSMDCENRNSCYLDHKANCFFLCFLSLPIPFDQICTIYILLY